ncbi:MAG: undecaprenyl-diphosphate phosphatase [Bacteroidetes bacterium]|nr:undecaprenyl-diphosphate phosphatase [Bacteroidota bacterium]
MSIFEALILGIVQGLTEFLPVSSSGHLELMEAIFGNEEEENMLMTVVLHAATALSTVVIFRKDIAQIFKGLFKGLSTFKANDDTTFSLKIIISMIPAAIIGMKFNDELEDMFSENVLGVGIALLLTGVLLFFADRAKKTDKSVGFGHAIIIGISQAIAIIPGISRSGATISTSVLLGIDRERAARFSFLMVVPLILGKMAKDIADGALGQSAQTMQLMVGFIAAFLVGLVACRWMIALVKRSKLTYFGIYCLAVGASAIIYKLAV